MVIWNAIGNLPTQSISRLTDSRPVMPIEGLHTTY